MANPKRILVTQIRSINGASLRHKACVRGLGLRRIGHAVDVEDTPAVRGLVHHARHLVRVLGEYWDFTRLSESERTRMRNTSDALAKVPMGHATPIYMMDPSQDADAKYAIEENGKEVHEDNINNGTGSLIRIDQRKYCVTAAHVLSKFRKRLDANPKVCFQVGNVQMNPFDLLVDEDATLDLAVLDMNDYSEADIAMSGEIPTSFLDIRKWPVQLPKKESFVMFGGYPKSRRIAFKRTVNFGSLSCGGAFVYQSNGQNIICQIETDRLASEDYGLPIDPFGDPAGISGGPVLQERKTDGGVIVIDLVGFVYEYNPEFDMLRIKPANWLNADGTLKNASAYSC